MKGLILSGGHGTRLRPITYSQQKQLIPIANKPILFYAIEDVIEAGATEIGIVVGPNKEQVIETVKSEDWAAEIEYIYQSEPKGLAHTILIAEDFLDDEFVMYLGDNILREGIVDHTKKFKENNHDASIMLTEVENPDQFGIAELNADGTLKRLIEKPKDPPGNLALVGIYFFKPVIMEACKNINPSWRNELEITDAIQWLIDSGHGVGWTKVEGWWKDTGKPEDILEANRLILDDLTSRINEKVMGEIRGRVAIYKGTKINENSVIKGPALIGRDCVIKDSYIGPYTSIGNKCDIINSEVEDSVVMDGAKLLYAENVVDSIIGRGAVIEKDKTLPKGGKYIIGDFSWVRH
ncbi:MAG: glucose-1-phosphate thymidylyltransferase [Methanophagales archaeon]|nr:glucose-1-phosphate thymidylyltransferase [Methanophagales archaeon]